MVTRGGSASRSFATSSTSDRAARHARPLSRGYRGYAYFAGVTVEVEDTRRNYGERRIICYGTLAGRVVVVGYTPRGAVRHIFSMRKANTREQARLAPYFEV